jgi:RHS repeat-associated protein
MAGATYYLGYDPVGSLRLVADGSGNVVKRISYDAFGNLLEDTNPGLAVPLGFAGGLHDCDTGLVRFGYRDYDPEVGRWTAKDPIGFGGGDTDLYGYVLNNPVNLIDPSGLLAPHWHFGITYVAARDSSYGAWGSLKLAWDATAVDFSAQGVSAAETVQHAMAFPGQSQSEAIAATGAFIESSIKSGHISNALHAAQDLATPGHQGKEWSGFLRWKTLRHILGDVFPSWTTINEAYQNSTAILNKNRCSE